MASSVLRKKKVFTLCRPIPNFIPRQLAIDVLHNHSEVITLNPLVINHHPIKPPLHAASDEYGCTWYEITERIQYIPGIGQMGSGKISFTGCFHDVPWGLQTHIYAPMSVDLRAQYRVAGNQAGVEPEGSRELGLTALGAPAEGLYLRTDIEFSSNIALAGFVRAQLKAAIQEMVDRMVKKAEQLDADVLQGMLDEEKMTTAHPAVHTYELQPGQRDPPAMRHSFSSTSDPTGAMELRGSSMNSQPGNYYNSQPGNYLNPQSGSYMSPAGNMRPQSMTSLPNRWSATDYPQSTGSFR
jgi:hypothetical protein